MWLHNYIFHLITPKNLTSLLFLDKKITVNTTKLVHTKMVITEVVIKIWKKRKLEQLI